MVQVKNIKQGTVWEITDEAMLKKMRAKPLEYKILEAVNANPEPPAGKGKAKD